MYLLDTSVLILQIAGERLSLSTRTLIADHTTELFISVMSAWEIAIKQSNGRLPLPADPVEFALRRGVRYLSLEPLDIEVVKRLPLIHKDPFDRALIAQAMARNLTIITTDKTFTQYPVNVLLA